MIPKPFWLFVVAGNSVACGAATPANCPDESSLAKLEANYIAEAVASCEGESYESCPALPAIRARYKAKREEWVRCR